MTDVDALKAEIASLKQECEELSQKLSRAELEPVFVEALENSSEAIVIYDDEGLLVACNESFRKLYEYSEEEARPGIHFSDLGRIDIERGNVVVGDEYGDGEAYLERKAEYRRTLKGSFIVKLKDGRWIKTSDRPMAGGGFVSMQTDVTEMKKTELALFRAKIEAELASKAKSDFLANISHDLRTPLNAILGFSDMMKNEVNGPIGNESYQSYTKYIHESGSLLLSIVNDILDTAKLENDRYAILPETFDPVEWTCHLLSSLKPIAAGNDIDLYVVEDGGFSGTINSDRRAITQILNNLVANACRHTEPGGRVTVTWSQASETHVRFVVADTGSGMPESVIENIGQPFLNHGSALAPKSQRGAGLGLYISYRLADLLGGGLSVESEKGVGTRVSVTLLKEMANPEDY